mmetsp:Transcript_20721/g.58992  ORF Transcript_20721/g.58992 Transcript_20721/m.58992 type:complete len:230 (+) Transcript_20721:99-788(+)
MREGEVDAWPNRHDAERVDGRVRAVVVLLDVVHVHGLRDAVQLVDLARVVDEVGVVRDALLVALEVAVVHLVKAHERDEETDVGLGDLVAAGDVALLGQDVLGAIEARENISDCLLVRLLRLREAGAVDAVVDLRVDPLVDRVDLLARSLRVEVQVLVLGGQLVELLAEHADDLRALVGHDLAQLVVIENRHRELGDVVAVHLVERAHCLSALRLVLIAECPAMVVVLV